MGVRLYHPALGRFLQVDPVPGGSANPYDYVTQDPVNQEDLSGTCRCDWYKHRVRNLSRKFEHWRKNYRWRKSGTYRAWKWITSWRIRVGFHRAHHTFKRAGRVRHISITLWRKGVKGSHRRWQIPIPFWHSYRRYR